MGYTINVMVSYRNFPESTPVIESTQVTIPGWLQWSRESYVSLALQETYKGKRDVKWTFAR